MRQGTSAEASVPKPGQRIVPDQNNAPGACGQLAQRTGETQRKQPVIAILDCREIPGRTNCGRRPPRA